jgi:hypothetical protein
MKEQLKLIEFNDVDWVIEMTSIVDSLNPNGEGWAKRNNLELHSKLAIYLVSLGQFMRDMQIEYNRFLHTCRQVTKTKADAEIMAEQSIVFSNWKHAKSYHNDLEQLIWTLSREVKLLKEENRIIQ